MSYQEASNGVAIHSASDMGVIKLVDCMPSPDLAAKIGIKKETPHSLAVRMPSPEIAAKVGIIPTATRGQMRRVQRRNAAQ